EVVSCQLLVVESHWRTSVRQPTTDNRQPASARQLSPARQRTTDDQSLAEGRPVSMLYYLLYPLRNVIVGFNVFRYITFRTAFAALTALLISFIFGPWLIERMRRVKLGQ